MLSSSMHKLILTKSYVINKVYVLHYTMDDIYVSIRVMYFNWNSWKTII